VLASLKALHNVHHLNDVTANKLRACALDDSLPTRVRAAVLDVFQSDACQVSSLILTFFFFTIRELLESLLLIFFKNRNCNGTRDSFKVFKSQQFLILFSFLF
jgi:hypothetical protein